MRVCRGGPTLNEVIDAPLAATARLEHDRYLIAAHEQVWSAG